MTQLAIEQLAGTSDLGRAIAVIAVMVIAAGALMVLRGWIAARVRVGDLSVDPPAQTVSALASTVGESPREWVGDAAGVRYRPSSLGWLPWIAFVGACALYLVVYGYTLSRSGNGDGDPWFWIGLAGIVAPIGMRLASNGVRTLERVLLVVTLVVLLYLVKVTHDPFAFTFADELVHVSNVEYVLSSGQFPDQKLDHPGLGPVPGPGQRCLGYRASDRPRWLRRRVDRHRPRTDRARAWALRPLSTNHRLCPVRGSRRRFLHLRSQLPLLGCPVCVPVAGTADVRSCSGRRGLT